MQAAVRAARQGTSEPLPSTAGLESSEHTASHRRPKQNAGQNLPGGPPPRWCSPAAPCVSGRPARRTQRRCTVLCSRWQDGVLHPPGRQQGCPAAISATRAITDGGAGAGAGAGVSPECRQRRWSPGPRWAHPSAAARAWPPARCQCSHACAGRRCAHGQRTQEGGGGQAQGAHPGRPPAASRSWPLPLPAPSALPACTLPARHPSAPTRGFPSPPPPGPHLMPRRSTDPTTWCCTWRSCSRSTQSSTSAAFSAAGLAADRRRRAE